MADIENKTEAANETEKKPAKKAADKKGKVPFRKKIGKFFRDYKSEMKKIVWYGRKQTINSTILVVITLIITSAIICALDFGFSSGLIALGKLI